jgi:hypothetical protein
MKRLLLLSLILTLTSCGGFQAKRVDANESDELALEITDKWLARDTETTVSKIMANISKHKGFKKYLRKLGREPKLFISEIQNDTTNAYFPIEDFNDELLTKLSETGDYVLIDQAAREKILDEITYQHDGMVASNEVKKIGKQSGADLLIFGAIRMRPKSRGGKTIKEYSLNIRLTDLERATEVMRTRERVNKYSKE